MVDALVVLNIIATATLVSCGPSQLLPVPSEPEPGCGDLNIVFTGLPAYHPLVLAQGFDPAQVDAALRGDAADIVEAGYNLRVVLMGPEEPITVLENELRGISWDGTGVGYGVRGSSMPELTVRFEGIIKTYRKDAPRAPTMFNYSPFTALWASKGTFLCQRIAPAALARIWASMCIVTSAQEIQRAHEQGLRNVRNITCWKNQATAPAPGGAGPHLSTVAICAANMATWGTIVGDYYCYMPPSAPRKRLALCLYCFLGLYVPMTLMILFGAAIGGAIPANASWSAAYQQGSFGAVCAEILTSHVGDFGRFLLVLLGFSIVT